MPTMCSLHLRLHREFGICSYTSSNHTHWVNQSSLASGTWDHDQINSKSLASQATINIMGLSYFYSLQNFLSIDFYPSFNKMPRSTHCVFTFILKVEAMLDKTICALSTVFIGSSGSTFTEDILRLRKDWGSASLCDEYLCQGEVPNFIADDEWGR